MKANALRKYLMIFVCILTTGIIFNSCSRNDIEILGDVKNQVLATYPNVDVKVRNAVVTLKGHVDSEEAQKSIISTVAEIDGVKSVNDETEVRIPNPFAEKDLALKATVMQEIETAKIGGITVDVDKQVVTLTGSISKADGKKIEDLMKGIKCDKFENKLEIAKK